MHAELPCLGIACNEHRLGRHHAGLNSRSRSVADDPLVDARIAAVLGGLIDLARAGPGEADVGVLYLPLRAWSRLGLRPGAADAVALPARWCLANAA